MMSTTVFAKPVGAGCFGTTRSQQRTRVMRVSAVVAAPMSASVSTMYEVLSVEETAGPDEIKAAYRRAARQWHPDACPGGAGRFMLAREAYEVLSNPERRRGYDVQLRCGGGGGEGFGDAGYRAARRAGVADCEAQLDGLQWRAAARRGGGEATWGSKMGGRPAPPSW